MTSSFVHMVLRQGGVFTREQALSACSPAQVRANLRRGTWRRSPFTGLYVDGQFPDDVPTLVRATSLARW